MHAKELKAQLEKGGFDPPFADTINSYTVLGAVTQEGTVQRAAYEELKHTWELANQHFIVAQDKLKQEIYRLQRRLKEEGGEQ